MIALANGEVRHIEGTYTLNKKSGVLTVEERERTYYLSPAAWWSLECPTRSLQVVELGA